MNGSSLILGIETSCDETAAAVVANGRWVRSSVVASQNELHAEYRGVVPEIASRAHATRIRGIVTESLSRAGISANDLDAVAVGHRPGLIGPLLVGLSAAKATAWYLNRPLVGVDHVHAHLYAGVLTPEGTEPAEMPAFPALGLVVSGGHTSLYRLDSFTNLRRLGGTIDDALGEAYDKVASIVGLPFPGGPRVDALARVGDERAVALPVPSAGEGMPLAFSYSGLKTAVRYAALGVPGKKQAPPPPLDDRRRADLCASFQRVAVEAVTRTVHRALDQHPDIRTLLTGGGVLANSRLRAELGTLADSRRLALRLPAMAYCVDNAAMIAGLAHALLEARGGRGDGLELTATPTTSI